MLANEGATLRAGTPAAQPGGFIRQRAEVPRPPTLHPPRAVGQDEEGSSLVPLWYLLRGAPPVPGSL